MGTNYYVEPDLLSSLWDGRGSVHIGKSSSGWCFSLHVFDDPKDGPTDFTSWVEFLTENKSRIRDEYGCRVTLEKMLDVIVNRGRDESPDWTEETLKRNHACKGPNNLVRFVVDGEHCVGHGKGTWDLIRGEFS